MNRHSFESGRTTRFPSGGATNSRQRSASGPNFYHVVRVYDVALSLADLAVLQHHSRVSDW